MMPIPRREAARGALLGTFVGDALGMPYEGSLPEAAPEPLEMVEARLGRGTYTDDTQMTIALAESLVEHGRVVPEALARAFVAAFEPGRGYGQGTFAVLGMWREGVPVTEAATQAFEGGSYGNGAAMRVAPVGVLFADDPERLEAEARRSAELTHAHPHGIDAAVVQAAAVGAAARGEDVLGASRRAAATEALERGLERVEGLLEEPPARPRDAARVLGNSAEGARSVPCALYAAVAHPSFEDAVTFAVRCGGDADTIAAMAGAVAGARQGADEIPARWLDALEDGPRGRRYVEGLAARLAGG